MSAKAFFDTNILIYLYSVDEPEKQQRALQTIETIENRWISTQVLSELSNTLSKKFKLNYSDIANVLAEVQATFQILTVKPNTIGQALQLADMYRYSYYDSLIIAAALEQSCQFLYSEDMQHSQVINQQLNYPRQSRGLIIVSPSKGPIHESPKGDYPYFHKLSCS